MRIFKGIRLFLFWYSGTLLFLIILFSIRFMSWGNELDEVIDSISSSLSYLIWRPLFHGVLLIPYAVFLIVRFHIRWFRRKGLKSLVKTSVIYFILPLSTLFFGFRSLIWLNGQDDMVYQPDQEYINNSGRVLDNFAIDSKHRGIHIFPNWSEVETDLDELVLHNVEWITLVPYGYQSDVKKPSLNFSSKRTQRRDSVYRALGAKAAKLGLRIMMKPHIWVNGDTWRSGIEMNSEVEWDAWFEQYEQFILHYAQLSREIGAEALCIGTELHQTIKLKPEKWIGLIRKIRLEYDGKLTYAANWDSEFREISFWNELDYIGIQAYFGLSNKNTPDVEELKSGWKEYFLELKEFSEQQHKPILFTEVGYKSIVNAAHEPWQWESWIASLFRKASSKTQANCYEALFEVFWNEHWFAGVHLWKWEGEDKYDFTPKNKPAANVMTKWFGEIGN
ncbi:MAG: hypothetical protein AAF363_13885 [Bacteroidota bacterium]